MKNCRRLSTVNELFKNIKIKDFGVKEAHKPEFVDVMAPNYKPEPLIRKVDSSPSLTDQVLMKFPNESKENILKTLYTNGVTELSSKNWSKATECFTQYLHLQPNASHVLSLRAKTYLAKNEFEMAHKDLLHAVEDEKCYDPTVFFNLGFLTKNLIEKLNFYQRSHELMKQLPADPQFENQILTNLADALFKAKKIDESLEMINKSIEISSNHDIKDTKQFYIRGKIFQHKSEFVQALKDYDRFLFDHPSNTAAHYHAAISSQSIENWEKAISHWSDLIRLKGEISIDPRDKRLKSDTHHVVAEYYYHRGTCYQNFVKYEEAIQDYGSCIKLNRYHTGAMKKRGMIHHILKKYENAIFDYSLALNSNFSDMEAFLLRSESHLAIKDLKETIFDLEGALAVAGQTIHVPHIINQLQDLYLMASETEKLSSMCKRILKRIPNDEKSIKYAKFLDLGEKLETTFVDLLLNVTLKEGNVLLSGYVNLKIENLQDAIQDYKKLIDLNPSKFNHRLLSVAQWKFGQKKESILNFWKSL